MGRGGGALESEVARRDAPSLQGRCTTLRACAARSGGGLRPRPARQLRTTNFKLRYRVASARERPRSAAEGVRGLAARADRPDATSQKKGAVAKSDGPFLRPAVLHL